MDNSAEADLVPVLDEVVRHAPVSVVFHAPGTATMPATPAAAIGAAIREALTNVARHAGVDTAEPAGGDGVTVTRLVDGPEVWVEATWQART